MFVDIRGNGTARQLNKIAVLIKSKDWQQEPREDWRERVMAVIAGDAVRDAGAMIDYLLSLPDKRHNGHGRERVNEAGMYRHDGRIYKVQKAVHGSGNLYAKELVQNESGEGYHFAYVRGAINRLSPADKMSLEEAKEFGVLYGSCCVCGRTLTKEESIAAGIGPICAGKGFWA